jgi:hypothetical protein
MNSGLAEAVEAAGFKRVEAVRVHVRDGHATATARGVVHRYPRTVRITLDTAARLAAAGVHVDLPNGRG